jgi:hypothetical protein
MLLLFAFDKRSSQPRMSSFPILPARRIGSFRIQQNAMSSIQEFSFCKLSYYLIIAFVLGLLTFRYNVFSLASPLLNSRAKFILYSIQSLSVSLTTKECSIIVEKIVKPASRKWNA